MPKGDKYPNSENIPECFRGKEWLDDIGTVEVRPGQFAALNPQAALAETAQTSSGGNMPPNIIRRVEDGKDEGGAPKFKLVTERMSRAEFAEVQRRREEVGISAEEARAIREKLLADHEAGVAHYKKARMQDRLKGAEPKIGLVRKIIATRETARAKAAAARAAEEAEAAR